MNKIFNKLFLGLAVCGLAMTACSDGVEWEPSPVPTEGVQAYIYADNTDLTYYPNDEQFFVVKIGRQKTDAAASIHLTTDAENVTVPTTVDFAAGEALKEVKIAFDIAVGTTASYTIAIPEEDSYVYGSPKVTVNIKRDYTWLNIGTGYYASQLFGEGWDQPVLKAKEANIYKLEDCITKGYPIMFTLSDDNQELIGWDPQPTGYDKTDYGMLYFALAVWARMAKISRIKDVRSSILILSSASILRICLAESSSSKITMPISRSASSSFRIYSLISSSLPLPT
jgi:hypothetical protein